MPDVSYGRVRRSLVVAAVVSGFALALYGVWAHGLYARYPWTSQGLIAWRIVVGVSGVYGTLVAWKSAYWRQWIAAAVIAYVLVAVGVGPLAGTVLLALAAWSLGSLVVDGVLRVRPPACDAGTALGVAIRVTAGTACLIALVQVAAHWPLNRPAVYALVFTGLTVASRHRLPDLWSTLSRPAPPSSWAEGLAAGLLTIGLALHVVVAAKPDIGHDALSMHLLIPAYMADHARWHFDVTRAVFSVLPMAGDWYFTLAYMVAGEFGARLANLGLLLLSGAWLSSLLEGWTHRTLRRVLVALYFSTPLLGLTSGTLFVEHLWSLLLLAAAGVALSEGLTYAQRWTLAALFLAVATATKVMAIFVLPVFAVAALVQGWSLTTEAKRRRATTWLIALLIIAVVGGWPYVVALAKTGNPVFPFMNSLFKSPQFPIESFDNPMYKSPLRPSTLYRITFDSGKYLEAEPGAAGFQWLIFLPAALLATVLFPSRTVVGYWIVAGALVVGVFSQQSYIRYLEPAAAFLTLAMAVVFRREVAGARAAKGLVAAVGVVILANAFYFASSGWYHRNLVDPDFTVYVTQSVPERGLINVVNALDPKARTMFLGRYFAAGVKGPSVGDNWYFPAISKQVSSVRGEGEFAKVLLRNGIEYVIGMNDEYARHGIALAAPLSAFDVVASQGGATLVRLKSDVRFTEQRLRNPEFKDGLTGWVQGPGGGVGPGPLAVVENGIRVTLRHHVAQVLAVSPGERYRVSLKVRCASPAMVRLQVNWLDASGAFLGTFLKPRECQGEAEFSDTAEVPERATVAIYYVGAHDERPVDVLAASFKR